MSRRTNLSRSDRRIVEEAQRGADLNSLKKAMKSEKQQRKRLQIETLQLESAKQQLMNSKETKKGKKKPSEPGTTKEGMSNKGTNKGLTVPTQKHKGTVRVTYVIDKIINVTLEAGTSNIIHYTESHCCSEEDPFVNN